LFKIKPPAPNAYAPEGHAKKITIPEGSAGSTGQAGICLIFRGLFFEHNPREIGSAFHRAGAEIG